MAMDLAQYGIITISMHPGWVFTDMGGPNAKISAQMSVSGMLKVMDSLSLTDNGRFLRWDGDYCPW